ncbi:potassium ABC transporter ATPase [Burkholderia sp. MSh2]|uniref:Potassium-transporting ATPase potassium-binding subunit n=1 Tax=Burkholderia paludis TaxID=1506587 RepID=A0A6J5F893_9BURK|nr:MULTISPECIES: potassium-transporting ATPase subunit KdpA [Burkholderia]KEZ05127.1 potassium ABC transporter ATPase [Burkholderia sp. MSh2]CAB3774001.1 Potassium-transporting ATPase potassium-binding subunit [Burkholderia paludis]VWB58657.1 ATPase [Burkholderia paludis]
MWTLPLLIVVAAIAVSIPLSRYMAWIMDGRYRAPRVLRWFEAKLDSGRQDWKQYTVALLVFNAALFVFGFVVLSLQPLMPLNPLGRGMLAPSTIFNTVISFMTNTNLQHYSGDQHLSNFSQIFFILPNMFLSAAVGLCALTAIIRLFRGQTEIGNFFVDMWRVVVYMFVPIALVLGAIFIHEGMPMTLQSAVQVTTLEPAAMGTADNGQAKQQTLVVGPVAAVIPIKMLGTNGGGFYGMNAAHPYENPSALSNFITTLAMMIFPFSLVLMYGRMLRRMRHAVVIYGVMLSMMIGLIAWAVYFDTLQPNPAFTAHPVARTYPLAGTAHSVTIPPVAALPVDPHLGNLEGKELRFGTSAGATFAAITTDVTCGAVNAEHDSLNPLAGLSPLVGMWLNCVFGGKGVGMINLLLFLIVGVFLAGQMVGRTPEYLGRKVGAREMKLAMIALLVHPILILGPTGVFSATDWGTRAEANPGAHGFTEITYQFASASANNGSAFDGLGTNYGLNANPNPAPTAVQWDLSTGLVMLFSRYLPIVAPVAMAAFLGRKKTAPATLGTMRDDTATFGFLLLGTIAIVGALLFLPVATLGPLAEHLGPMPFGG